MGLSGISIVAPIMMRGMVASTPMGFVPGAQGAHVRIIFSAEEGVGVLGDILSVFKEAGISLRHIESRPSKRQNDVDFFADVNCSAQDVRENLLPLLSTKTKFVHILDESGEDKSQIWFPRKMVDLDLYAHRVLTYGSELASDHPGFQDEEYRARRKQFADIAHNYRTGQPIPRVEYTPEENQTWKDIFEKLLTLYPKHACREHQRILPLLRDNCNFCPESIPQLEDVSTFLQDCTGFRLRPVAGLLSSRDFLNGLAFRVFHCTQYIRHHTRPFYTPEPDICHELLGHVPLFADPDFAAFSQEIGLASLGASDQDIEQLATLFWFTVEFGLCRQDGEIKAYGAGLLSSFGELEYSVSDKPEHRPFEPSKIVTTKYPITEYQPVYFIADSFQSAKESLGDFAKNLSRPFGVHYNPYTQSVEVFDNHKQLTRFSKTIQSEMQILADAMERLERMQDAGWS